MCGGLLDVCVNEFVLENPSVGRGPVHLDPVVGMGVEPACDDVASPHRHRLLAMYGSVEDGLQGGFVVAEDVDGADAHARGNGEGKPEATISAS